MSQPSTDAHLPDMTTSISGECPICRDTMRDPTETPCRHVYCRECLDTWLDSGNNTCPSCRRELRRNDQDATSDESASENEVDLEGFETWSERVSRLERLHEDMVSAPSTAYMESPDSTGRSRASRLGRDRSYSRGEASNASRNHDAGSSTSPYTIIISPAMDATVNISGNIITITSSRRLSIDVPSNGLHSPQDTSNPPSPSPLPRRASPASSNSLPRLPHTIFLGPFNLCIHLFESLRDGAYETNPYSLDFLRDIYRLWPSYKFCDLREQDDEAAEFVFQGITYDRTLLGQADEMQQHARRVKEWFAGPTGRDVLRVVVANHLSEMSNSALSYLQKDVFEDGTGPIVGADV